METYPPLEWLKRRLGERLGRGLWAVSWVTPAPVWISQGDNWQAHLRWYGLAIQYPNRPSLAQLSAVPAGLRPFAGFVDDVYSSWTPNDLNSAVTRFVTEQYGSGNQLGGVVVAPSFFGRDP